MKRVDSYMERIASFSVDHNRMEKGIYCSRRDLGITTYDIRMKKPNAEPVLENAALHTIEHLFATFARNSRFAGRIVYVGPMGCRTGFYLLTCGLPDQDALALIKETFAFIAGFTGAVPGATAAECGHFTEHDLHGARKEAENFLLVIRDWTVERLSYVWNPQKTEMCLKNPHDNGTNTAKS